MPINIALLGSGLFAAQAYLPAITSSKEVHLHTIWSRSEKSVTALLDKAREGKLTPAHAYGEDALDKILGDKEIDAVLVVLPISVQPKIALRVLKAGKHVMTEKPVAKDVKSALEAIEVYEKEYKPKGLLWRVAENFAHEPVLRYAGEVLRRPELGPVLYWSLINANNVANGAAYHSTLWRTIPDYQGGFLLDGGVHQSALVRTVLPALPTRILSTSALHRTHLPPHDTIQGLALPPAASATSPHGPEINVPGSESQDVSRIPTAIGKSSATGMILITFAAADHSAEHRATNNGLSVTTVNARVDVKQVAGKWRCEVHPGQGSEVKAEIKEGKPEGVSLEIDMFARAVEGVKGGKETGEENYGELRGALWDLGLIQAMLDSNGKEVDLEALVGGK